MSNKLNSTEYSKDFHFTPGLSWNGVGCKPWLFEACSTRRHYTKHGELCSAVESTAVVDCVNHAPATPRTWSPSWLPWRCLIGSSTIQSTLACCNLLILVLVVCSQLMSTRPNRAQRTSILDFVPRAGKWRVNGSEIELTGYENPTWDPTICSLAMACWEEEEFCRGRVLVNAQLCSTLRKIVRDSCISESWIRLISLLVVSDRWTKL